MRDLPTREQYEAVRQHVSGKCPCGALLDGRGVCGARAYPVHQALFPSRSGERLDLEKAKRQLRRASGVCEMCGKPLRTPESLARGIGPDCWAALHPASEPS